MKMDIDTSLDIPEGVSVSYEQGLFTANGPAGTVQKVLRQPKISIEIKGAEVMLSAKNATQREKRHMHTLQSHIKNMMQGAQEPHVYKLKICSGHFPMNCSVNNGQLVVKNFLGEAVPRTLTLKQGADVKLDGDVITVSSASKETAGQTAADIEQLTRITNRDRRIFQDGIYITVKDGKEL